MKLEQKQGLAKKHFGQNFLQDEGILNAIVQAIPKQEGVALVEIGAGLGDLTNKLLSLGNITAYEVDKELIPYLQKRFDNALKSGALRLIVGDVLEGWREQSLQSEPYFLVANLPYYIATLLLVKLIKDPLSKGCVVMTQKEVAQKFCASAGDSDFGALSVLTQSVANAEFLFSVPPSAFVPQPKVTSAVFLLQKQRQIPYEELQKLESFLKVAFCAPRKTILNNLSKGFDKKRVECALESLQIAPNKRPHEIDTTTYHRLLKNL